MVFLIFFLLGELQGGWSVKIKPVQYEWYVGEPIWIELEAENLQEYDLDAPSKMGFIELNGRKCNNIYQKGILPMTSKEEGEKEKEKKDPPGARLEISFELNEICNDALKGAWWQNFEDDEFYGKHNICYVRKFKIVDRETIEYKLMEERFCDEIKIIYPAEGEDRDFYNKYIRRKNMNNVTMLSEDEKLKGISEYPTSRYIGWILDKFYNILSYEMQIPKRKREMDLRFIYENNKKDIKEIMRVYALNGEKFLKKNKNHPLEQLINATIAYEFYYLNDLKKAKKYAEKALLMEFPAFYKYFNYYPRNEIIKIHKQNLEKLLEEIKNIYLTGY